MAPRPDTPRRQPRGLDPLIGRVVALVVWIAAGLGFASVGDLAAMDETLRLLLALGFFTAAGGITLGLMLAGAVWQQSEQVDALDARLDALQETIAKRPAAPEPAAPATDSVLFLSQRARVAPGTPEGEQPRLHLAQPSDAMPPAGDLIRALHFPKDAEDRAGFDATRRALANPRLAPLIHAAQEVLSQLSEEGIFMDDLHPDRARPEIWRAFAQGVRGAPIAPLGGVHDRACLALTQARMRANPGFRASAHEFLREFDRVFAQFTESADDAQITALAQTRTARAFMLLGRVTGVFSH